MFQRDFFFCQGYGLTETAPVAVQTPLGFTDYTSVGWGIPNSDFKVIDQENNALGPNAVSWVSILYS